MPSHNFQPLTCHHYDAIVIGTALPHALLAAALARANVSVLHLDQSSFYGSANATITTTQISSAITNSPDLQNVSHVSLENSFLQPFKTTPLRTLSLADTVFPFGARLLVNQSVRATIDLLPRPLLAAGPMVDLLIRSNVGHYIDFRPLDAMYVQFPLGLRRVPASRADVFQSRSLTMPEKRLLMRFVKRCQQSAHDPSFEGTFADLMHDMALTPTLRTFLAQSIAFCKPGMPAQQAMDAVFTYQQSLMRFGTKTPFLYPNYGTGELPQAFCRLCAVHGGTYVLRRGAAAVITREGEHNENEYPVGVVTAENEVVHAHHVFLSNQLLTPSCDDVPKLWRFAAVLNGSITNADEPDRVLVTVPARLCGNSVDIRIRQLDSLVMVCESGNFVLYAETVGAGTEDDVLSTVRQYVRLSEEEHEPVHDGVGRDADVESPDTSAFACQSSERPLALWAISYARPIEQQADSKLGRVTCMLPSEEGIDTDQSIAEAERCFRIVRPDGDFFPQAQRELTVSSPEEEIPNGDTPQAASLEATGD